MKLASVCVSSCYPAKSLDNNKNLSIKQDKKLSSRKSYPKENFRGQPWILDQDFISGKLSIKAADAINLHKLLALGNYLDLNGGKNDEKSEGELLYEKEVRANNLSFLDKVTEPEEKEKFIEYYKKTTGFPNLAKVSDNIISIFKNVVRNSQMFLQNGNGRFSPSYYEVIVSGYDGVSSVAKKMPLPGSDLDKAFVIIRGTDDEEENQDIINEFKGQIWENTDQRTLSYNHDTASFPKVYALNQVHVMLSNMYKIERQAVAHGHLNLDEVRKLHNNQLSKTYTQDYIEANPYFLGISKELPVEPNDFWGLDIVSPSRQAAFDFATTMEALYKGDILSGKIRGDMGQNSNFAKFINISQIEGLKRTVDNSKVMNKPKYKARVELSKNFDSWDTDTKYDLVKTLIKYSCGDNEEDKFKEYFHHTEDERYQRLLDALFNENGNDNASDIQQNVSSGSQPKSSSGSDLLRFLFRVILKRDI